MFTEKGLSSLINSISAVLDARLIKCSLTDFERSREGSGAETGAKMYVTSNYSTFTKISIRWKTKIKSLHFGNGS